MSQYVTKTNEEKMEKKIKNIGNKNSLISETTKYLSLSENIIVIYLIQKKKISSRSNYRRLNLSYNSIVTKNVLATY